MIGKLRGTIDSLREDSLILDVQGVGYLVFVPRTALFKMQPGQTLVTFYIETIVKEDSFTLYGFETRVEQTWFRVLQTVQGVGARLALGLLSQFTPNVLYSLLLREDKRTLSTADGVGPKLATRLVTELKERILKMPELKLAHDEAHPSREDVRAPVDRSGVHAPQAYSGEVSSDGIILDVLSALENLGYRRTETLPVIHIVQSETPDETQDVAGLLRHTLKALSKMNHPKVAKMESGERA
jgi:Holliday junction DNA helicase RuvA